MDTLGGTCAAAVYISVCCAVFAGAKVRPEILEKWKAEAIQLYRSGCPRREVFCGSSLVECVEVLLCLLLFYTRTTTRLGPFGIQSGNNWSMLA